MTKQKHLDDTSFVVGQVPVPRGGWKATESTSPFPTPFGPEDPGGNPLRSAAAASSAAHFRFRLSDRSGLTTLSCQGVAAWCDDRRSHGRRDPRSLALARGAPVNDLFLGGCVSPCGPPCDV